MNLSRLTLWAGSLAITFNYPDRDDVAAAGMAVARMALAFGLAFVLGEAGASAVFICGQRVWCRVGRLTVAPQARA